MWSLVSRVGQLLGLSRSEPEVDWDAIAAVLDAEDEPYCSDQEDIEDCAVSNADGSQVICQHRTGVVTELYQAHGYITSATNDGEEKSQPLHFQLKYAPPNLQIGNRVVYLAFRLSDDSEWVVRKVLYVENELWDNREEAEEEVDNDQPVVKEECETAYKHVIARVTGRDGRTVLAGEVQFSLDTVQIDFIPVEGDWLSLSSLVQPQTEGDTVLLVDRVSPLRSTTREGCVTHWTPDCQLGIVDGEVMFSKEVCEPGYLPRVGDQVTVYCIESEQGQLIWRAIQVVATAEKKIQSSHDPQLVSILQNKQGIVISENTNFGTISINQEKQITIEVRNDGDSPHTLIALERTSQQSQFLILPLSTPPPVTIQPSGSLHIIAKAKGRFVGRASELLKFRFEEVEIGRQLAVDVQNASLTASLAENRSRDANRSKTEPVTARKLLATRNGFIVPGVRPIKPASFVPVHLGMFAIPEKLVKLVLGPDKAPRKDEVIGQLLQSFRCVAEPLSGQNYVARWDTLIYIEELEHTVNIRRYDTVAALHRVEEYLSLEILGLAERRPSLMVGDRVIARPSWSDEHSWVSDSNTVGYEGYIHKVLSNEVLLKFNPSFHDSCSGVYSITFQANRTSFRRLHQAVHVGFKNLSTDWLFPTRVSYQPPQVVIVGEEDHKRPVIETRVSEPLNTDCDEILQYGENVAQETNSNSNSTAETNYLLNEAFFISSEKSSLNVSNTPNDSVNSVYNSKANRSKTKRQNGENVTQETNSSKNSTAETNYLLNEAFISSENSSLNVSNTPNDSVNSVYNSKANRSKTKCQNGENVAQETNSSRNSTAETNYLLNVTFTSSEKSAINVSNTPTDIVNSVDNSKANRSKTKRQKSKVSDMFAKLPPKEDTSQKVSPPRVPVVERFLKNGNCHSSEKSPKEVENLLKQFMGLPCKTPKKNAQMKTLEEIEKSLLNNSVLDGIKPLSNGEEIENSPIEQNGKSIGSNKNQKANKELQINHSHKSHNQKNDKNNVNESTRQNKHDKIKWNSNIELKIGNEKEAVSKIPLWKRRKIRWFNPSLNHYQKEAVRNILKGEARPFPYVIFGPPGTGKTITVVEAVLQIYFLIPESRLLIATPSNSAADLVCERLLSSGLLAAGDLLRLCSFHYADQGRVSDSLKPYCGTADIKAQEYNSFQSSTHIQEGVVNISRHAIGRHRVTVGTCGTLAVLYQMGFPRGHFTHVVVDEAGQATEPEILIPLVFLHKSHSQAILAGDPLQLGPVVLSSVAEHFGMGESFLSRLLQHSPYCRDIVGYPTAGGYNPHLVTRLVYNYRSLPEILDLPNSMFYDGVLIPKVSITSSEETEVLAKIETLLPARPDQSPPALVFHGVRGTNCQATESPSWYNPHEAVQATMYLQSLYNAGLTPDQCGIITPYQAQVLKIRQLLDTLEVDPPKVGSVEEFQGQERMVIILSTVRSSPRLVETDLRHSVGFVASPRRLNVAITRARACLIVVGNPHLLARDNYWRTVLQYCVNRGGYTGCDLPADLSPS